jgi:phosphoserine phosphatase
VTSRKPIVGVVFDLDGTLAPDTTSQHLKAAGVDLTEFWTRVSRRMSEGWDQTLAYMGEWLTEMVKNPTAFSFDRMVASGASMRVYDGALRLFDVLREDGQRLGVRIEFYLISSGLRPIVESMPFASEFTGIWASNFVYDSRGMPYLPKASMSFTDKTRPLIAISKGIGQLDLQRDPFAVNRRVRTYRIPFPQMVYVGDGLTDVPAFALLTSRGGRAVAVFDPADDAGRARAQGFVDDQRVLRAAPADYGPNGAGLTEVREAVMRAAEAARPRT